MAESEGQEHTMAATQEKQSDTGFRVKFGVWLLTSVAFVAYLMVGSVEIRLWQSGRMTFVDRDITHVWAYFGERLPELPSPALTSVLYWLAIAVMVLTTIVGLWYFLIPRVPEERGGASAQAHASSSHD